MLKRKEGEVRRRGFEKKMEGPIIGSFEVRSGRLAINSFSVRRSPFLPQSSFCCLNDWNKILSANKYRVAASSRYSALGARPSTAPAWKLRSSAKKQHFFHFLPRFLLDPSRKLLVPLTLVFVSHIKASSQLLSVTSQLSPPSSSSAST